MPGFADFEPSVAPLDQPMVPLLVYRLDSDEHNKGGVYRPLPNIVPLRIEKRVGAQPGRATFSYVLDPGGPLGDPRWPRTPEQVLAPGASGPYIVAQDDRIVVFGVTDGGDFRILFDGFAQSPRATIDPSRCKVEFHAMGTPVRCSDSPIWGRVDRACDAPADIKMNLETTLPVVFNPDGDPSATAEGKDGYVPSTGVVTPVFLDALVCKSRGIGRKWSLAMAVHYLLAAYNDQTWVSNGPPSAVDPILDGRVPIDLYGEWDPQDPETYTSEPIVIREFDATGMRWPDALEKLLTQYGFQFVYQLSADDITGRPRWSIRVFRVMEDDPLSYKLVKLQPYGSDLDPAKSNAMALSLERDSESAENEVVVYGPPGLVEASFVLSPHFIPKTEDASVESLKKYDDPDQKSLADGAEDDRNFDDYRTYVFDEAGDGHWDWASFSYVGGPGKATSMDPVFNDDVDGSPDYVKRRRPGRRDLLSVDADGDPRPSLLLLSTNYTGPVPGIWDGSGRWYQVGHSWKLLDDRLGVYLTAKNPEAWQTGNKALSFGVSLKSTGGIVKGVSAQALPTETHFHLMLTTVIESDVALEVKAPKRLASASKFAVQRYVDAQDRYRKDRIAAASWYNIEEEPENDADIFPRDDSSKATADAAQKRGLSEMPAMSGPITLFGLVNTYYLTERIVSVQGRGLSLITNVPDPGEGSSYPMVVGIDYDLDGHQLTTLHLHDQRGGGSLA